MLRRRTPRGATLIRLEGRALVTCLRPTAHLGSGKPPSADCSLLYIHCPKEGLKSHVQEQERCPSDQSRAWEGEYPGPHDSFTPYVGGDDQRKLSLEQRPTRDSYH